MRKEHKIDPELSFRESSIPHRNRIEDWRNYSSASTDHHL